MVNQIMGDSPKTTADHPPLTCCCCGDDAGRFAQHHNRDTGYGICPKCVAWMKGRGTSLAEIEDLYGVAGVNYAAPMHTVYGRRYAVLAEFTDDDSGMAKANEFMRQNDGAALLANESGRLILAHKDDRGTP